MLNKTETEEFKQQIIDGFARHDVIPGAIITVTCEKDNVLWQEVDSGKDHYGCGQVLAQFQYKEDMAAVWDIAADLFLVHISNWHGLVADFGLLTD